jgi:hypothetical protein
MTKSRSKPIVGTTNKAREYAERSAIVVLHSAAASKSQHGADDNEYVCDGLSECVCLFPTRGIGRAKIAAVPSDQDIEGDTQK